MEQLIGLIIFAIVAGLGQWLQKRAEGGQQTSDEERDTDPRETRPPTSQMPQAPKPGRAIRWQDELRKQLGESNRPVSKPVILHPANVPQLPQVPKVIPPALPRESSEGDLVFKSPLHSGGENEHVWSVSPQADVAKRMEKLQNPNLLHPLKVKTMQRETQTDEMIRAIKLTKSRNGIREAFIASVILGTPKALQGAPGLERTS